MHCIFYERLLEGFPITDKPSNIDVGKSKLRDLDKNII